MDITDTLARLVTFKSVTDDPRECKRAMDWCIEQVRDLPLFITRHTHGGMPSATLTTQKTKTPVLWLLAHIDVVPARDEMFHPRIEGGRLIGRGTYDMKFAIACYLTLLRELADTLPTYDFGVMLTADEETGGGNGVKWLVDNGWMSRVCIAPDGGEDFLLEKKAKGLLHLKFSSVGTEAHGARPWEGENAIERLAGFLLRLEKYFRRGNARPGFRHTCSVGGFSSSGTTANVVPSRAEALVDIRFTSRNDLARIERVIAALQKRFPGISSKRVSFGEAYEWDFTNSYIRSFLDLLPKDKRRQKGVISHGSSDARYFAARNIPTILTRPRGGGIHSDTEWVDLDSVARFYAIMKAYTRVVALLSTQ